MYKTSGLLSKTSKNKHNSCFIRLVEKYYYRPYQRKVCKTLLCHYDQSGNNCDNEPHTGQVNPILGTRMSMFCTFSIDMSCNATHKYLEINHRNIINPPTYYSDLRTSFDTNNYLICISLSSKNQSHVLSPTFTLEARNS